MVKNLPARWQTWVWSLRWKIPWRREWLPTPPLLPRELQGQRSLAGYSPWGHKESGHNWATNTFTFAYWRGHWEERGLFQEVGRKALFVVWREQSLTCSEGRRSLSAAQLTSQVRISNPWFHTASPTHRGTRVWTEGSLMSHFSGKGKQSRLRKYWLGPFSGPLTGIQRRTGSLGPFSEPSCVNPERTSSHCPSTILAPPVLCLRSPSGMGGPHSFTGCQEKQDLADIQEPDVFFFKSFLPHV